MKSLTQKERDAIVKEEMAKAQAKEKANLDAAQKEYSTFMEQWTAKYGTTLVTVLQIVKK
jgi:predicted lipoprotein